MGDKISTFIRSIKHHIPAFTRSTHGNVTIISSLMLVLFISIVGGAVDYGRYILVSNKLQTALDASALSAVINLSNEPSVQKEFRNAFDGNYVPVDYLGSKLKGQPTINKVAGSAYYADARVEIPSVIMQVFGVKNISLTREVQVTAGGSGTAKGEIAFVIDTSDSMNAWLDGGSAGSLLPSRFTMAQNELRQFSDRAFNDPKLDDITYNMIPYTISVLNLTGGTVWAKPHPLNPTPSILDNSLMSRKLVSAAEYDTSEAAPSVSVNSLFYERDPTRPNPNTVGGMVMPTGSLPPYLRFGIETKTEFDDAVNALRTAATHQIWETEDSASNIGLLWGWQTLSPNWIGKFDPSKPTLPQPYNTPDHHKAIVLISDGMNGYPTPNETKANAHMDLLCSAIKAKDIELYTIVLNTTNVIAIDMMRNCATSTGHFFQITSSGDLADALDTVTNNLLTGIRIVK